MTKCVLPQCPSTTELLLCLQYCIYLLKILLHDYISNHSQLYFLLQFVFNIGYKEDWSEVIQYQRGTILFSPTVHYMRFLQENFSVPIDPRLCGFQGMITASYQYMHLA